MAVSAMKTKSTPALKGQQAESKLIEAAVKRANGNLSAAARLLGLTRPQLAYRLGRLGESEPVRPDTALSPAPAFISPPFADRTLQCLLRGLGSQFQRVFLLVAIRRASSFRCAFLRG